MTQPTAQVIVSQAEFARLRGVSRATVTHWKRAGRLLLTDDGKVNVAASEELLSQRPETYRGGRIKPTDGRSAVAGEALQWASALRSRHIYATIENSLPSMLWRNQIASLTLNCGWQAEGPVHSRHVFCTHGFCCVGIERIFRAWSPNWFGFPDVLAGFAESARVRLCASVCPTKHFMFARSISDSSNARMGERSTVSSILKLRISTP